MTLNPIRQNKSPTPRKSDGWMKQLESNNAVSRRLSLAVKTGVPALMVSVVWFVIATIGLAPLEVLDLDHAGPALRPGESAGPQPGPGLCLLPQPGVPERGRALANQVVEQRVLRRIAAG